MSDPLFTLTTAFHRGSYSTALSLAQSASLASSQRAALYGARAALALGDVSSASALLSAHPDGSASKALSALVRFVSAQAAEDAAGEESAIEEMERVKEEVVVGEADEFVVDVALATALAKCGREEEALIHLGVGEGRREIECTALAAHILLSIHRADVAEKEYTAARSWADDSLLIQLIEAYLGLTRGGRSAQQAYYVYDELASDPAYVASATAVPSLVGKAVAQLCLGDRKGAGETVKLARGLDPQNADLLANEAVLAAYSSPEAFEAALSELRRLAPAHPLVARHDKANEDFDAALLRVKVEGVSLGA